MRIGEVAHRTGVSTRALRYYEEQGLLVAERTSGGQRTYGDSTVERVRMIQQLFAAGLPSRTIAQLMPSIDTGQCSEEVRHLMLVERDRISATMDDLAAARDALDRILDMANSPHPEYCPGLREPPWAPYRSVGTGSGVAERPGLSGEAAVLGAAQSGRTAGAPG